MPKKLVLCVDDEAIILLSLKAAMKTALGPDYAFETALSAEEALAQAIRAATGGDRG